MTSMNCRSVRNEIERADFPGLLDPLANDHLRGCAECQSFSRQHLTLREIVSSLGTVKAPDDFDFHLRARLARENSSERQFFFLRRAGVFGARSAAFATVLVAIGAVLLFVSMRNRTDSDLSARSTPVTSSIDTPAPVQSANAPKVLAPAITSVSSTSTPAVAVKPSATVNTKAHERTTSNEVASVHGNGRIRAKDLSSTGADFVKQDGPMGPTSTFSIPVASSYQSVTVSLDNGKGTSRKISLPSVSFGSQRALSQNTSPLLASARESW